MARVPTAAHAARVPTARAVDRAAGEPDRAVAHVAPLQAALPQAAPLQAALPQAAPLQAVLPQAAQAVDPSGAVPDRVPPVPDQGRRGRARRVLHGVRRAQLAARARPADPSR